MFKRYEKIPASLHFTLHTVNLKRKINSNFKLSFQRGSSYHGATDLVHPDDKGILKFEASYDTKCTLYLSKQDATTKPKKLKIILHRFTDQNTSKIYGKIVIDVSKYYGSKSVSYEEFEMESGRSIPPVLGISIIIKQAGQSVVGAIDQSDKSFIDEDTERIPVNDWDKTEIDNNDVLLQRHTDSKKKKKDKKKKVESESSESDLSDKSEISEKSEEKSEKEEKPKKKKNKKKKTDAKQDSESQDKEEKEKSHHHKSKSESESAKVKRESKLSDLNHDSEPSGSDKKPMLAEIPELSDSDEKIEKEEDTKEQKDSQEEKKEAKPKKKKSKKKKTEEKKDSDSDKEEKEEKPQKEEKEDKPKKEKASKAKKPKEEEVPKKEKVETKKQSESSDSEDEKQDDQKPEAEPEESPVETKDTEPQVKVRSTSSTPVVIEKPKEEKKVKSDLDIEQMITSVIARSWTNDGRPVYLDAKRRIPLPAAVFTIYSVLLQTKVFSTSHVDNKEFSSAMDTFFDEYENAPICDNCTSDQRFITTLCLLLLINRNASESGFAPERVKKFTTRLLPFLNDYARQIVAPLLINFEVLCNRFATARFEVDPLLEDFREVLDGIKSSLMYTQGINEYLLKHFMQLLDVKLLNKLLANPARFVFSKAITWNSFLTAFLSAEKCELPLLRQAVWTLVMAVNMTSNNEPGEEVRQTLCPTLDPKIIVYLLKSYKPDDMMPTQINWKKVADEVHIDDVDGYEPVRPVDIDDYNLAGEKLKVQSWNQIQIEKSLLKLYPYFPAYYVPSH